MRLLRGEDSELASRAPGVTAATLSGWREAFLGGDEAALATKPVDAKDLELDRLKAELGEVALGRELMAEKIAVLETGRPLGRRRPRR
jgi:transposase